MSIGIRVAKIRLLDTRQSFRLGAEHRLEPDEWPELARHRFCLRQNERVDHLIASAPYVSTSIHQQNMRSRSVKRFGPIPRHYAKDWRSQIITVVNRRLHSQSR